MNELDLRCSPPVTDSQSVFQKRAQRGSATADPAQKRARDTRRQLLEAARAAFLENDLGTLEPGKYADLVVLERDIFTIDPIEIEHVKVDLTMVEGAVVYERD